MKNWFTNLWPKKRLTSHIMVVDNPDIKVRGCYWEKEPTDAQLQLMGVMRPRGCCQCGACPGGCVAESKP